MADIFQPSLSALSSLYQTIVREYQFTTGNFEQVAELNGRRWFIQFQTYNGAGNQYVVPGPQPTTVGLASFTNLPIEYKFKDCPSVVQGEFYGQGMPGGTIIIVECIYLR